VIRRVVAAARSALLVAALALAVVTAGATPAAAHGLGGLKPTNYESRLVRISPSVRGIAIEVEDLGTKLQLTNHTGHDVVVLGYDHEPYLRVGPRGSFENTRSPATYLNRTLIATSPPPSSTDASAAPNWKRIGSGNWVRWHDHRTHYTGTEDPPMVQRDRDHRHVITDWEVQLRDGRLTLTASGEIVWVPPPSPLPFVAGALALAALVIGLSRTRRWRAVLAMSLATISTVETIHVVGLWGATTASTGSRLAESAYSIAGVLLGVSTLAWMRWKGTVAAVPVMLVATIFLFVAGGLADATSLGNSQLPTTLPWSLARLLVMVTLGVGAGLAAASGLRLRTQGSRPPGTRPPGTRPRGSPRRDRAPVRVTN
jgi:hypothetical protein